MPLGQALFSPLPSSEIQEAGVSKAQDSIQNLSDGERNFFARARVPRQAPPPPCCHQGPARDPRLSPSPRGQPVARGQHLAKRVRGACGSAAIPGNLTLETLPLAVRAGLCHCHRLGSRASAGSGSRPCAPDSWRSSPRPKRRQLPRDLRSALSGFRAPRPGFPALNIGLCAPAPGSAPLALEC